MKKILIFSRDPGGANTVASLCNKIEEKGYEVKLYGKDSALNVYEKFGLKYKDIKKELTMISQENIISFLEKINPNFVITATSADDFTEKYLWKACEKLNIKSFAILDQWINYGVRFSSYSVNELEKYNLEKQHHYTPYKILVMDEYSKNKLKEEGITEDKILVSGQPYFDYLVSEVKNIKLIDKYNTKDLELKDKFIITFASEPLSLTYKENDESDHYWGFTERTIFKSLIKILNKLVLENNIKIELIIKLHPKENENNYEDIVENINKKFISVSVKKNANNFEVMEKSDLVCGMSSMFLIESAVLGIKILSIQIGLKRENPFILDKIINFKTVLNEEELEDKLKEILILKDFNQNDFKIEKGAINKVINYMEEIL